MHADSLSADTLIGLALKSKLHLKATKLPVADPFQIQPGLGGAVWVDGVWAGEGSSRGHEQIRPVGLLLLSEVLFLSLWSEAFLPTPSLCHYNWTLERASAN